MLALPGEGTGHLREGAQVLDAAVDAPLADGAPSVDVVGYSAGGVTARLWADELGAAPVARRIVKLGARSGRGAVAVTLPRVEVEAVDSGQRAVARYQAGRAEVEVEQGAGQRRSVHADRVDLDPQRKPGARFSDTSTRATVV